MTDAYLMDADCIHGNTWFECTKCDELIERDLLMQNPYEDTERKTIMMVELTTFGTKAQAEQSVKKIKKELALQGLKVEISDVHILE